MWSFAKKPPGGRRGGGPRKARHAAAVGRLGDATSRHRVDAAKLFGLFHERHHGGELQVLEFLEVDATAARLHLAELRGIFFDKVAAVATDTDVEGIAAFPRDESDGEPVAFATAGRFVVILAVADEGRGPHAPRHERRELRHGFADGLVQGRHRGAAIGGEGGEEFLERGECLGHGGGGLRPVES